MPGTVVHRIGKTVCVLGRRAYMSLMIYYDTKSYLAILLNNDNRRLFYCLHLKGGK